ncbi:MAG: hypothetical protein U0Q22_09745 [Acidimicrobiales bacterium]
MLPPPPGATPQFFAPPPSYPTPQRTFSSLGGVGAPPGVAPPLPAIDAPPPRFPPGTPTRRASTAARAGVVVAIILVVAVLGTGAYVGYRAIDDRPARITTGATPAADAPLPTAPPPTRPLPTAPTTTEANVMTIPWAPTLSTSGRYVMDMPGHPEPYSLDTTVAAQNLTLDFTFSGDGSFQTAQHGLALGEARLPYEVSNAVRNDTLSRSGGIMSSMGGETVSQRPVDTKFGRGQWLVGTVNGNPVSMCVMLTGRDLVIVFAILPPGGAAVAEGIVHRAVDSLHHS